jgi:hypothetical protein
VCDVYLNPDIHNGSYGTVLAHATTAGKRTINLPTSGKVAIRASANVSGGVNTSVMVLTLPAACQTGWARVGYQAWWSDTGQDPAFGSRHAHIDDLCIPANNKIVDGSQTFSWFVQLHNQPAGARETRLRINDQCSGTSCSYNYSSGAKAGSGTDIWKDTTVRSPNSAGDLIFPVSVTRDLSKLGAGRHEFRFAVYVTQPNGKVQLLSSRTQICIRSCSPAYRSLSSFPVMQGNGAWYEKDTNPGYIDTRTLSALPVS